MNKKLYEKEVSTLDDCISYLNRCNQDMVESIDQIRKGLVSPIFAQKVLEYYDPIITGIVIPIGNQIRDCDKREYEQARENIIKSLVELDEIVDRIEYCICFELSLN